MERIERALEVARLHRHRMSDGAAPGVASLPPPAPAPNFAEALAEQHGVLRIEDAPSVSLAPREVLRERYVVFPDEEGAANLAYRMLRTQVLQRTRQHGLRCVGVVSAANGEGKTLTAVNLALSLSAEPNQPVVLVDLDLKRPSVAKLLGLDVMQGVDAVLAGPDPLEAIWRRCAEFPRLAIVPAIAPIQGSAELLAGPSAASLIKTLRSVSGDPLVLVDLPPALLSADVLAIAPQLDAVVMVVSEERTRREDIQSVLELLSSTPVVGTVLNASVEAEARSY